MSKPSTLALPNGLMDSSPVPSPKSFQRLSAYSIAAVLLSNVCSPVEPCKLMNTNFPFAWHLVIAVPNSGQRSKSVPLIGFPQYPERFSPGSPPFPLMIWTNARTTISTDSSAQNFARESVRCERVWPKYATVFAGTGVPGTHPLQAGTAAAWTGLRSVEARQRRKVRIKENILCSHKSLRIWKSYAEDITIVEMNGSSI